jgi:hypothetical protein
MYDFDNINFEYGYDDDGNEDDNSIHFYVEWEYLNDPGGYGIDESVTATTTSIIEQYYASGVNQVDVSGYLPTISQSALTPIPSPDPV